MSSGRRNKLTGQIAEHLVCAELGRRDIIATPFSGNVPGFDVIAVDAGHRAVPIQVKATRSQMWPGDARDWMDIHLDSETGIQHCAGPKSLSDCDLIYICVALADRTRGREDRFFVLTKGDLQTVCVENYTAWMASKEWRRPRNPASFDCRWDTLQIARFEGNWQLIASRLLSASP